VLYTPRNTDNENAKPSAGGKEKTSEDKSFHLTFSELPEERMKHKSMSTEHLDWPSLK
jgi:hypothetical protein